MIPQSVAEDMTTIRRVLSGILIILTIIATFFARDVLMPVILGVLLSLTLSPIVRAMGRFHIPAPLAATLLIVTISLTVGIGAFFMSGPISGWVAEAPAFGTKLRVKLAALHSSVEAVKAASDQVDAIAEPLQQDNVQKVTIQQPGLVSSAVSNLASAATSVSVAMVLALLLLASGDLFYAKLVEAIPKFSDKKKALRITYGIERSVSRYLFTVFMINGGLGAALALCLAVLGFPSPLIWGTLAFFLNFLPYIGMVIGVALIGAVSIITYDQFSIALLAPGAYVILNSIEGQFVTPMILGRQLELNTVSVFLTVIFWGWLWGIAGALMAVPFLVFLKVVCDNIESLRPFGSFLGARNVQVTASPTTASE
jgi:predicted PurR-regulated permease PerM